MQLPKNVSRYDLVTYSRKVLVTVSKSKLLIGSAIISILYLLIVLLIYTRLSLACMCEPCALCNITSAAQSCLPAHGPDLETDTTVVAQTYNSSSQSPTTADNDSLSDEVKRPGGRPSFNYNLRNVGPATSNEELTFLLNVRKLVLFAVHELNKPLKNTSCIHWWANPLDLSSAEEISKSDYHIHHRIKFTVQPGNYIYVQVEIMQKLYPISVNDAELEIVSPFELLNAPSKLIGFCDETRVCEKLEKTCVCSKRREVVQSLQHSTELSYLMWNTMDPDLRTWRPFHSFMVEDYLNYTDYEGFLLSPGNTTNEVLDLKYSSEYCGPSIKMLVMVKSAPSHFNLRMAIRETYGSPENLYGKGMKVVFLTGLSVHESINMRVATEFEKYGDIIQPNFVESYHNLTLGHLNMFKWIQLTCGNEDNQGHTTIPKYILKADDDYLLNVDLALRVAEENTDAEFIGHLKCGTNVVRNFGESSFATKYYTPRHMYISGSYMGYFLGIAFLIRGDVVPRLIHASITTPMIHMDDVYVTGMLLRQLRIHPRHSTLFSAARQEPDICMSKTTISSNVEGPYDMKEQWMKLYPPKNVECSLDGLPIKVEDLDERMKRKCFYE